MTRVSTPNIVRSTQVMLGLTQAEFATLIGISRPTIARAVAEGATVPPLLATVCRLIDALGAERTLEALVTSDQMPAR